MTIENQTQASEELEQDGEQESAEQSDDEQTEEVTDELDADTEKVIADYGTKIAQLDEKLAEYRDNHVENIKIEEMKAAHYNDGQIERYIDHVGGITAEEIKESVFKLSSNIPPVSPYGDPSAFNGVKEKPRAVGEEQLKDIGRKAFQRVQHKIPGLGGRK